VGELGGQQTLGRQHDRIAGNALPNSRGATSGENQTCIATARSHRTSVLAAERAHGQSQHQLAILPPNDVNRAQSQESAVMGQYAGIHTMIKNAIEGHIPVLA